MSPCASCGAELRPGLRFCSRCGTPVAIRCSTCGGELVAGDRFCGSCGAPGAATNANRTAGGASSTATAVAPSPAAAQQRAQVTSERRLVSVLFADLVGFTTLSEHRDPEEVRELLSQYFERCRALIERYGGTVEKFIGDAVMAVWGTPVAREDDPERAVRAALALTASVTLLGQEVGMPGLRVRAGVLTGRAAVERGAEGEGMVLGDTVNTASRLQSIAQPGTVLVDDVTRRASEAAIAYEDAGTHHLKGREQPVHAFTALRVVAGAGGARRGAGLEAPFVARQRELQAIIDAGEQSAHERRAGLVAIVGEAGSGKSRLLWEFFKYLDGIQEVRWWHQGRCLSYGEGVAYWALAEMVRARAGILEEEDPVAAREKLRAVVVEHVADERERRLVEPRLAHLLGLEQRVAADRADLFSGWRLFFERMARSHPVILAFEDLQWADSGLLEFIDYLLEWSADFPIFVIAFGRPELLARRPSWGSTIALEPVSDAEMAELLDGLVPGLPAELAERIRRRAEGVPLYAVETVRMLLDRGLVAPDGARYVVTGDVSDLEVPETLQALAAARLDNLGADERALLQDAAVIGQSFTPAAVGALGAHPPGEVERLLEGLVAKQVLAFEDDPRTGERGQYIFLQALVRTVALSTLSRRDRKARHLAAVRHLTASWGEEVGDIAEVLASHHLAAIEADPDAADAESIRAAACQTLADAGRRAISLALGPEARRHFEHAAELAGEPAAQGRLLREAGQAALLSGELEESLTLLSRARELLEHAGEAREAALIEVPISNVLFGLDRAAEADERLAHAAEVIDAGGDRAAQAALADRRAAVAFNLGRRDDALRLADEALAIAEAQRLGEIVVSALTTKGIAYAETGRPSESAALLMHAVRLATEQDLGDEVTRACFNLAENLLADARFAEAEAMLEQGLAAARHRGDRMRERQLLCQGMTHLAMTGRWEEALARLDALRAEGDDLWATAAAVFAVPVLAARGDRPGLERLAESLDLHARWPQMKAQLDVVRAIVLREEGRAGEAVEPARDGTLAELESALSALPMMFGEAVETALAADRPDVVGELIERVQQLTPAQLLPLLDAEAARARGLLAAHRGETEAAAGWLRRASDLFREIEAPFLLARAQVQLAELLAAGEAGESEARSLAAEAAEIFGALGAAPWLTRAGALALVQVA